MAVPRHTRTFKRGPTRKSLWLQFEPVEVTLGGPSATSLVFSLNAAALALRPFTVVRTHWELKLMSDQAAAVENQAVALGIAVVSDEAATVGITAVPLPSTNAGSALWFLHAWVFGDGTRTATTTTDSSYRSIDSKAMRKVDNGQDVVVVLQGGGVGSGMFVTVAGRQLVKTN